MSFRKLLYWPHLLCGVFAGIFIFILSATGVILTYERQIIAWAEGEYFMEVSENEAALSIEELKNIAVAEMAGANLRSIKIQNVAEAPIVIRGDKYYYINRYSGEILGNGPEDLDVFFGRITSFHRWFLLSGENRNKARIITGAANLMFLFILFSGLYLWLPKVFRWSTIKNNLFFHKTANAHARDFNWHHVLGIWSALPLIVIVASGAWFYYDWADGLADKIAGDGPAINGAASLSHIDQIAADEPVNLDSLFAKATAVVPDWHSISMSTPRQDDEGIRFSIDKSPGGQPTKLAELTLNRETGLVDVWQPYENNAASRKMSHFLRFAHTGEYYGIIGQTIAGLVSLFATVMVWTGLALAYRKYVTPWLARRAK